MNLDEFRSQLELEMTWRTNEIRFLRNQIANIPGDREQRIYRKSLVVMLYSHYEGFCKSAFSIYIDAINHEQIKCQEAHECLVAASLHEAFRDLANPQKKSKIFGQILPDDSSLHRFARQVELIEKLNEIWNRTVNLSSEQLVDAESNLTPKVLRKILYRLGFPYDLFEAHEGKIHQLLHLRNGFAHGSQKDGLSDADYKGVENAVYSIMDSLIKLIYNAVQVRQYAK